MRLCSQHRACVKGDQQELYAISNVWTSRGGLQDRCCQNGMGIEDVDISHCCQSRRSGQEEMETLATSVYWTKTKMWLMEPEVA